MASILEARQDDMLIARFAAFAICIHILEGSFPSPFPGIKPGLANVVSLIVFYLYGWRFAAWVTGLRVLVGSILMGSFLSPAFFLSASGALASMLVIGLFFKGLSSWIGPVGISILASLGHMGAQFYVAYELFIPHEGIFKLLPLLMSAALVFGMVNGIVVLKIMRKLHA